MARSHRHAVVQLERVHVRQGVLPGQQALVAVAEEDELDPDDVARLLQEPLGEELRIGAQTRHDGGKRAEGKRAERASDDTRGASAH